MTNNAKQNNEDHKEEHPQEELEEQQQEVVTQEVNIDYKDNWLRAQADYQNLQKEV